MLNSQSGLATISFRELAQLLTVIENEEAGSRQLLESLQPAAHVPVIGITGPPGAGKSTLINALIKEILKDENKTEGRGIAVLAVDPSSPFTKGALLGDRLRMSEWFNHPKVFIRSLATRGSLGGLSARTVEITDVMIAAGFDFVFIETVGIGQSEVEIASLADVTALVLVPESGDEVQTLKAGVMEIADVFVVNKSDRSEAGRLVSSIQQSVMIAGHEKPEVICTVATRHEGIDHLLSSLLLHKKNRSPEKNTALLFQKALKLIQQGMLNRIDVNQLRQTIENESRSREFNIYRVARKFIEQA